LNHSFACLTVLSVPVLTFFLFPGPVVFFFPVVLGGLVFCLARFDEHVYDYPLPSCPLFLPVRFTFSPLLDQAYCLPFALQSSLVPFIPPFLSLGFLDRLSPSLAAFGIFFLSPFDRVFPPPRSTPPLQESPKTPRSNENRIPFPFPPSPYPPRPSVLSSYCVLPFATVPVRKSPFRSTKTLHNLRFLPLSARETPFTCL